MFCCINQNPEDSGFSLVELAIVLVILGLLTGGILAGSNLIRAAELRGLHSDLSKIQVAVISFKDRYKALPGDMKNATRFWGAQAGGNQEGVDVVCAALDYTSPATGKETCNGDGDNVIQSAVPHPQIYEALRAWQHLSNAGLIDGQFTGVRENTGGGGPSNIAGKNVFGSKVGENIGWTFISRYFPAGSDYWPERDATNNRYLENDLIVGANSDVEIPHAPFLTVGEMYLLDNKFDDSFPFKGKLRSANYNRCTDAISDTVYVNANYDPDHMGSDDYRCSLILKGFS